MFTKAEGEKSNCLICGKSMKIIAESDKWEYLKCVKCNWYTTKRVIQDEISMNYDDYETFDNCERDYSMLVNNAERILAHKFNLIGSFPKSFLDIGTSEGVFVKAYNNLLGTNDGIGIEVSRPKIARAKERGLNVMHFSELSDEQFDFILLRHVIEHIENPREYLGYISKWLSPKGVLCVETPNNDCWIHRVKGKHINDITREIYVRELYPPVHVCGFTPKSIKKLGEEICGLKVLRLVTYDNSNLDFVYSKDARSNTIPIYRQFFEKLKIGPNIAVFLCR